MNIEKSLDIIKGKLLLIDKMLKQDQEEGRGSAYEMQTEDFEAIETLLTAYENLKAYNKGTKEALRSAEELERQANKEAGDWEARCFELEAELEKEKKKNKKIEIIVNKLMPLAECSYWNYENHTCNHTCGGCDDLNEDNRRTSSGILIDKDRYCRLYEDGYAEEDTKFVSVEDLINRHLKEE